MALTRVKDSLSNPRTLHSQAWGTITNCSLHNSTAFWLTTNTTSSWILNLTDVPTFVDDRPEFVVEFRIFWYRSLSGQIPGFRVNGIDITPSPYTTSTTTNAQYLTKVVLIRRNNNWTMYATSQPVTTSTAQNPAITF
jgi:hypothetical protein